LLESIPLLFTLINMMFIWSCVSYNAVAIFNYEIHGNNILLEPPFEISGDLTWSTILSETVIIGPLNIFMYTFSFLFALGRVL